MKGNGADIKVPWINDLVESLDANVVMDDSCVGSRAYFTDVEITDDPMDGLVRPYCHAGEAGVHH